MIKKSLFFGFIALVIFACAGDNDDTDDSGSTDSFDRGAMLAHLADDLIVPAFEDFQDKIDDLDATAVAFTASPTITSLESVQASWLAAYKTWQHIEMFNIGKAESLGFVNYMNIYPLSASIVDSNISNGGYNLSHPNNYAAQGFPALDYLLYGIANDKAGVIAIYTGANASGYKTYLEDVIAKMSDITTQIVNDWNGAYRDEFVNSSDNTPTSSLNLLVNDFISYYESGLRANKYGTPIAAIRGDVAPEKVEAFYNNEVSNILALEALNAVEDFFNGKDYGGTTEELSFKAYLEFLDREDIVIAISDQLEAARNKIISLDDNLYQQIVDDKTPVLETYDELQKVVAFLKVDMLNAFSISVGYQDNDGD